MAEPGNFGSGGGNRFSVTAELSGMCWLLRWPSAPKHTGDGTRALMSNLRLAEILGRDERTVSRYTQQLRDLGYLELTERGHRRGDGTLAANVYELSLQDTQVTSRDEPQQDTQMSSRDSAEQQHTEFSTGQNGASTGHPGVHPLFNPSSGPNGMECITADATTPNQNTKKTYTDWRAEDEDLFRQIMEVDHVTFNSHRYLTESVYQALREHKDLDWPGRYCQKIIDDNRGLDEFLDAHFPDMDRWAD